MGIDTFVALCAKGLAGYTWLYDDHGFVKKQRKQEIETGVYTLSAHMPGAYALLPSSQAFLYSSISIPSSSLEHRQRARDIKAYLKLCMAGVLADRKVLVAGRNACQGVVVRLMLVPNARKKDGVAKR